MNQENTSAENEYDKRELFEDKIRPLIKEIRKICIIEKIPFCASFAVANYREDVKKKKKKTENEVEYLYKTKYENEGILTGTLGLELYENYFEKYLLALRGGHVLTPEQAEALKIHETISAIIDDEFEDYEYEDELEEVNLPSFVSENPENTDTDDEELPQTIVEALLKESAKEEEELNTSKTGIKKDDYKVQSVSNGIIFVDI